jgi:hypothetical protein
VDGFVTALRLVKVLLATPREKAAALLQASESPSLLVRSPECFPKLIADHSMRAMPESRQST